MIKNNIEKDVKMVLIDQNETVYGLASSIGTTGQYLCRVLKRKTVINKTYIKLWEKLGYDLEIKYVKR